MPSRIYNNPVNHARAQRGRRLLRQSPHYRDGTIETVDLAAELIADILLGLNSIGAFSDPGVTVSTISLRARRAYRHANDEEERAEAIPASPDLTAILGDLNVDDFVSEEVDDSEVMPF